MNIRVHPCLMASYTWDYRNRLVEAQEKQSGNWVTVAEYKCDPSNRRASH